MNLATLVRNTFAPPPPPALPEARGFVVYVNQSCERRGYSHIVTDWHPQNEHVGPKPVLACGDDSGRLNWTLHLRAPTVVCPRCAKRFP